MAVDTYHVLYALTVFALAIFPVFIALCFYGARRIIRVDDAPVSAPAQTLPDGTRFPAVSIMKPCAGADDDLERCLESFCVLRYPRYQIVLGVRDASDPAYPILTRVAARHPEVDICVVVTGEGRHPSPKVNNLEGMAARMKHPLVWFSDSNTRVHPDTLAAMVEDLHKPGVGLVVSPVAGHDEQTLGAAAESLQLTAYIAQWTFIAHGVANLMIAPGKSSLLRRETLEAIGGWDELGKFFGEDFILFERVRASRQRVELGRHAIANVSVRTSVKRFLVRHLRWMQIRWRVTPSALIEPILTPIVPGALFALACPGWFTLGLFALCAVVQLAGDLAVLARLRGAPLAPRLWPMVLLRPFLASWLWLRAMFDRRVEWRGNQFWMGSQSRLLTEPPLRARLRAVRDALRAGG